MTLTELIDLRTHSQMIRIMLINLSITVSSHDVIQEAPVLPW